MEDNDWECSKVNRVMPGVASGILLYIEALPNLVSNFGFLFYLRVSFSLETDVRNHMLQPTNISDGLVSHALLPARAERKSYTY